MILIAWLAFVAAISITISPWFLLLLFLTPLVLFLGIFSR